MTNDETGSNSETPRLYGCKHCGTYARMSSEQAKQCPKCPRCRRRAFVPAEDASGDLAVAGGRRRGREVRANAASGRRVGHAGRPARQHDEEIVHGQDAF